MIIGAEWIIVAFLLWILTPAIIVVLVLLLPKLIGRRPERKESDYPARIFPKCGKNLSHFPDDIRYCPYCGSRLASIESS